MTTLTAPAPAGVVDVTMPDWRPPLRHAAELTIWTTAVGVLAVWAAIEQAWAAMYGFGTLSAILLILATAAALHTDRVVSAGQDGARWRR